MTEKLTRMTAVGVLFAAPLRTSTIAAIEVKVIWTREERSRPVVLTNNRKAIKDMTT
jgi:hypothetical protein